MHHEQWAIGLKQILKTMLFVLLEGFIVFQEQKARSFENRHSLLIQLGLLPPSYFLYPVVHEG